MALLLYWKHTPTHIFALAGEEAIAPRVRTRRRGRPANPSTVAGRLLEQRAQGESVRDRELHGLRMELLQKQLDVESHHVEAQKVVLERLKFEFEIQKKKMFSELSATKANEIVAHKKARQSAWEEKLAKKKFQLFMRNNPELDSD